MVRKRPRRPHSWNTWPIYLHAAWWAAVCFYPIASHLPVSHIDAIVAKVFAVFLTVRDCPRIKFLNAYIQRSPVANGSQIFDYAFVNYTKANQSHPLSLTPPEYWIDEVNSLRPGLDRKSREMIAMDFFALTYFLELRHEDWFYRGTDDTIINFRRLPSFLRDLHRRFNPRVDPIVRGDCVIFNKTNLYLQGGTGFLCSRRAAQMMAANLRLFLRLWVIAEDTTFGPFLNALGIGIRQACSGAFMGHGSHLFPHLAYNQSTGFFHQCPPRDMERVPPHHIEPVRDLLVYHKKDRSGIDLRPAIARANILFGAHESVRWYTADNFWPVLCMVESPM
jgi:hypothetical protein